MNQGFRDLSATIKRSNICGTRVSETEERLVHQKIFEDIIAENLMNLVRDLNLQNQEVSKC